MKYFITYRHKMDFLSKLSRNPNCQSNNYLATVYLLSSHKALFNLSKKYISKNSVEIDKIDLSKCKGIYPYALISMVYAICGANQRIDIHALGDKYIVDNDFFDICIEALRINRYGRKEVNRICAESCTE